MSKRIQIDQKTEEYIRAGIGDPEADVSQFAVFEARTLSTEPIKRSGGFYNKAEVTLSTLNDMAKYINEDNGAIPLQIMHDTEELPVGKVFRAQVVEEDRGVYALNTQFYLPANETDLIGKIENSVIDEVSVGFLAKHAYCSECDFDYFAKESSIMNIFFAECENEHQIGVDGVHVRLVGLEDFAEVSLVNRGAATNAKILSRAKQSMGQDRVKALAASGNAPVEARLFSAQFKLNHENDTNNQGDLQMDKEILAELTAKTTEAAEGKVAIATLKSDLEAKEALATELTAKVEELNTELTELKAASEDAATLSEKNEELAKFKKDMEEATDSLIPHVKAALTASGAAEGDLAEKSLVELTAMVTEAGLKLHQVIGSEPVAKDEKTDLELKADAAFKKRQSEAFKTNS